MATMGLGMHFNPHTRVGDDLVVLIFAQTQRIFQSASPVWGMTGVAFPALGLVIISIHIPRVGDDDYCRN